MNNKDDKDALLFCHPDDVKILLELEPELEDSLVIMSALEPGTVATAPRDEFLEWLFSGRVEKISWVKVYQILNFKGEEMKESMGRLED